MRRKKQLLIDVSELVQRDSKTGIQRVVRSLLLHFLTMPKPPFRMTPVYSVDGSSLLHAGAFTKKFLRKGIEASGNDREVQLKRGDIYLGLDLTAHLYPMCDSIIERLQQAGVTIYHVVYDLTPLQKPSWHTKEMRNAFKLWFKSVVASSQQLICISKSTQADVRSYIAKHEMRKPKNQRIDWFHLGCDIEKSRPSNGLKPGAGKLLRKLSSSPTLLMVSTIEPRKGHSQVLQAIDILWRKGRDFNLCVVGKPGWNSEAVQKQILTHRLFNKRLFWISDATDEYLEKIYQKSVAILNASEAEGFGLPMIEAARHGLPIIARDIPVNREICGKHAFYFQANCAHRLAKSLEVWLGLHASKRAPGSERMPVLAWRQSSQMLLQRIVRGPRAKNTKNKIMRSHRLSPTLAVDPSAYVALCYAAIAKRILSPEEMQSVYRNPAAFIALAYAAILKRNAAPNEIIYHERRARTNRHYITNFPAALFLSDEVKMLGKNNEPSVRTSYK